MLSTMNHHPTVLTYGNISHAVAPVPAMANITTDTPLFANQSIMPKDPSLVAPDVVTEDQVLARMNSTERKRYHHRKRMADYLERKSLGLVNCRKPNSDNVIRLSDKPVDKKRPSQSSNIGYVDECFVSDDDYVSSLVEKKKTLVSTPVSPAGCPDPNHVWRCKFCQVDNYPPFVPPYCSVCSYSLQRKRHRSSAEVSVIRSRLMMSSSFDDGCDKTNPLFLSMTSSEFLNDDDGPPDSTEGWAMEERRTVAAVNLNEARHATGYFRTKSMSRERLMELRNQKYVEFFQALDAAPISRNDNSTWFMLFFQPLNTTVYSTKQLLRNLDLSSLESQRIYLRPKCPAIQRSYKSHFYFIRGLDQTLHSAVGPQGFSRLRKASSHVTWEPIANNVDVAYDPKEPHFPIVANTESVTVGTNNIPFLSFLRDAFLNGSTALSSLGDCFLDLKNCFNGVLGFKDLVNELLQHASHNAKRKCIQLHWGKTPTEGGAWEKSSRASRRSLGDMSVVLSYSPELRRWLVFMLVLETYLFKHCTLCPSDFNENVNIWSFCSERYRECRQSLYDFMNGAAVPSFMVLADTSTLCFGRQVYATHTDKLNDCFPGQDGVSLFSSFFDLRTETSASTDLLQMLNKKGCDPCNFCVACIAYTRLAVGKQAMKNSALVGDDEPVAEAVMACLCPDIPDDMKDTEWIEHCISNTKELENLRSKFQLCVTSDWGGYAIKRKEGWSRDFFLSSLLHGSLSFMFSHHLDIDFGCVISVLLFVVHDVNGQPLCQLLFWYMRNMSTKEFRRRMKNHGNRLYCVLCDVVRELKPSKASSAHMPSSSSNRFRAQNHLCSLFSKSDDYDMVDLATSSLSSLIISLQSLPSKLTTLQVLKHGDSFLESIICSKHLKGINHLRGVLCVQIAAGLQLIHPDFFNYASVTNSLGPHKFFERVTGNNFSKKQSKELFRNLLLKLKTIQPKLFPHVKGIENTCCILGKVNADGTRNVSPEFIFCENGACSDGRSVMPGTVFDGSGIQNFFKWKEGTKAYQSELVMLYRNKWVPLVGLFRPFYYVRKEGETSKLHTFYSKIYRRELLQTNTTRYRSRQVQWALNLPPHYPQEPFSD